ncbi:MAG: transketolase [Oscillospiraceae bacterium]|nr:transketolase [Oscillospiraceae bacterium]
MDEKLVRELEIDAAKVRIGIIDGVYNAKCGHPGGALSIADALVYMYKHRLNVDPADPNNPSRDRVVLSKGHSAPALYAVLALRGFFPFDELKTLRQIGSMLEGHPDWKKVPGVDASTGSLGQGISQACGMALAGKLSCEGYKVYTILGDGELEEGMVWEAAMFASHYKLDNLVAIVDNNNLQIDGKISEVMSPYPIDEKFEAFGWNAITINGHDFSQMEKAFDAAERVFEKPTVIILKTTKGKGVDYMENAVEWHGKAPGDEDYQRAAKQLREHLAELEGSVK